MVKHGAVAKPGRTQRSLSGYQKKLQARLDGAQFRMLNETLYTSTAAEANKLMSSDDGTLFRSYHTGFAAQCAKWPRNPLDSVIVALRGFPASAVVADFGCGEARLAKEARQSTVHSFDLVAVNERITACSMSSVPLSNESVDIVVFCLALMGTDYGAALAEARRVLKTGGIVLVAEVASRFEGIPRGEFVDAVESIGFRYLESHPFVNSAKNSKSKQGVASASKRGKRKNKKRIDGNVGGGGGGGLTKGESDFFHHFVFEAVDSENADWKEAQLPSLKPCIYKRR